MDNKSFFMLLIALATLLCCANLTVAIKCPSECYCNWQDHQAFADCADKALTSLPTFEDFQIDILDLSNNYFTEIPSGLNQFPSLETLKLSGNQIAELKPGALDGLDNLRVLLLNLNSITSLESLNPSTVFQATPQLHSLSLSGNPITTLTGSDPNQMILSDSLKILDISGCKINKITGDNLLNGLPALEHFLVGDNPIKSIPPLISSTLYSLDISNARLATLETGVFANLPALAYLNLAKNSKMSLAEKTDEYVQSVSLRRINLSYCNMDKIELQGFPNLVSAIMKGNMIRELNRESFEMNKLIETLDLSFNSIQIVNEDTFVDMPHLKSLDLSFNMIPKIDRNTFIFNNMLTKINLGRNYISRLNRMSAPKLTHLNMSYCEITSIDVDAFKDLPDLNKLDLSNNLISVFPDTLHSDTLQYIDLSMCRLSSIRNDTFLGFPDLTHLNLNGNRFTTPFRVDFFKDNPYLRSIALGDNPWRCDCYDSDFQEFYGFLIAHPYKITDRTQVRCNSPEAVYAMTWENACGFLWFPPARAMSGTEKAWTIILVSVIVICGAFCTIMTVKRCIRGRRLTRREEERVANVAEMREIREINQRILQQEALPNAPDARESKPPCYEDALKLPRLDGSFASLTELGNARMKKKALTANPNVTDSVITDIEPVSRRNRCRSEETIPMRESNVMSMRRSNRRSTRPDRELPPPPIDSVENIRLFQSVESSPYAQRRTLREDVTVLQVEPDESSCSSREDLPIAPAITIIENHYDASNSDSDRNTDEEYTTFTTDEIQATNQRNRQMNVRNQADESSSANPRREQSPKMYESDF